MSNELIELPKQVNAVVVNEDADPKYLAQQLQNLQLDMRVNFVDFCRTLYLFQESNCAEKLGYSTFADFCSNQLDISASKGHYCIKIAAKAEFLGISRAELVSAKSSSLIDIFSLDETSQGEVIKDLVTQAKTAKVSDIKEKVNKAKSGTDKPNKFLTIKVTEADMVTIEEAIELARKNHGDSLEDSGEVADISTSKALSLICVEYLQDPNNTGEGLLT